MPIVVVEKKEKEEEPDSNPGRGVLPTAAVRQPPSYFSWRHHRHLFSQSTGLKKSSASLLADTKLFFSNFQKKVLEGILNSLLSQRL